MQNNEALTVPFFKMHPMPDEEASRSAGRPISYDIEAVEIRIAGDRNYAPLFPAHSMWMRIDGEPRSYADRWPEAYARFKANHEQVAHGTPLSEVPFLTESKRVELRGLKVYTAEALASLDGKQLLALGPEARSLKNKAAAYLESAGGSAKMVALASENEEMRAEMAAMRAELAAMRNEAPPPVVFTTTDEDERETLKSQIAEISGSRPRGNPNIETLREMVADLKANA